MSRDHMTSRFLLTLLVLVLGAPSLVAPPAVVAQEPAGALAADELPDLAVVPTPSLTDADASVRGQVSELLRTVETERQSEGATGLAEAYGSLGMLYLHHGFLDAADPAFDNASRLAPEELRWPYYRAVALEASGQPEAAVAPLRQVLSKREGNLPAVLRLADLLAGLGQAEEAEFLYRAALQSPLGEPAGHAGLGRLALEAGDARSALEYFQKALEAQPQATALRYQLGLAHRELGQLEEARELLAEPGGQAVRYPDPLMIQLALQFGETAAGAAQAGHLAEDRDSALVAYRQALEQNPDDLQTRLALATTLLEAGNRSGAEAQFREVLERDPNHATAKMELGTLEILQSGDPTLGIPYFEQVIAAHPDFREAHLRLARALDTAGRTAEAVAPLRRAVELDPRDREVRLRLVRTLLDAGQSDAARLDEALVAVRKLVAESPDFFDARLLEGRVLAARAEPEAAAAIFEPLSESVTATATERAEAYFNLGLLRQAEQRIPEAVGHYRKAIDFDPEHQQALYNLAVIEASNNRLGPAIEHYQRLFELDPSNEDYRYRLAVSQMRAGDHAAALGHFEALHQAHPKIVEFVVSSALLLDQVGQGEQAVARLETAIAETEPAQPRALLLSVLGALRRGDGDRQGGMELLAKAVETSGESAEARQRYAQALAQDERYSEAADQYAAYVELVPEDTAAWFARATALVLAERWADARTALGEVTAQVSNVPLTHMLARLLATAPDPAVRDGERAVQVAEAVFAAERNPGHGETLALALAAAGRFEEAIALQERLLQEAEAARFDPVFIERVKANLERFRAGEVGVVDW